MDKDKVEERFGRGSDELKAQRAFRFFAIVVASPSLVNPPTRETILN